MYIPSTLLLYNTPNAVLLDLSTFCFPLLSAFRVSPIFFSVPSFFFPFLSAPPSLPFSTFFYPAQSNSSLFNTSKSRSSLSRFVPLQRYAAQLNVSLYNTIPGFANAFLFSFRCPFLHRVAGDVERRYHLRYYKTSPCVHETDPRGYCAKNGAHCAFAHGQLDLRQPVYDIREIQAMEQEEKGENRQVVPEDPRWNGKTVFLLV